MGNLRQINLAVLIAASISFTCTCNRSEISPLANVPTAATVVEPAAARQNESKTIRFLEERIKRDPDDFIANNKLASEYLQRLRETGDITYLTLASRAANASLATLPAEQNKGGLTALVQVEFASHNFVAARDHAKRLAELEPNKGYPYQFLGDALLELGQYGEAESAFRQMEGFGGVQPMTRVAIEQRRARMAFLHGDNKGAMRYFAAALKIAGSIPDPPKETVAWCQWQLGETAFMIGDNRAAENFYRASLSTFPEYPRSLASLGRVLFAQGDIKGAIENCEAAVKILPDPNFVATLGDLYQIDGRWAEAEKQYELVKQIGHLSSIGGTLYNRQLALFYADHNLSPEDAYASAVKEYEIRRDIYGADAVAWTALKAGRIAEAQSAIKEALRLGTKESKLYYHAAMIAKAAGDNKESVRLLNAVNLLNPRFDPLQAVIVQNALRDLKSQKN